MEIWGGGGTRTGREVEEQLEGFGVREDGVELQLGPEEVEVCLAEHRAIWGCCGQAVRDAVRALDDVQQLPGAHFPIVSAIAV